MRARANAERQLSLLCLFREDANGGRALLIRDRNKRWLFSRTKFARELFEHTQHFGVAQWSRHHQQRVARRIVDAQKIQQLAAADMVEWFLRAGQRAAQRVIRPECFVQHIVDKLSRLIAIHRNLFLDHAALFRNVGWRETGIEKHVHQHVDEFAKPSDVGAGENAGVLFGRKRIQKSADTFDCFGDFPGAAPGRAFEKQMFNEMDYYNCEIIKLQMEDKVS